MKRKIIFSLSVLMVLAISIGAQSSTNSEDELKTKANELFKSDDFKGAKLLYAQLLSLYPKDPTYNYRYGACVLQTEADKSKPLKYLNFAASKPSVDPLAYFYLGRAHHLNYDFAKAVKSYSRFKNKASSDEKEKYDVDRQIEMCKNGNNLLSKLNEVQVLERQEIAEKDFYRIYDETAIGGKLIVKPEEFKSKYDLKVGEKSIIYLSEDAKEVYYSSYGKKGENGKDIYKAVKLGNGTWSEGVNLGPSINTKYDEDFAFIKPDGRTLYFASKGHTSMGGYDIFRSVLDEATGQWKEPENLDFAFSSADDDVLFVTDQAEITAYFASNRANEFGEMTVYKVLIERAPAELSVINGSFISESNASQKQAKITVIDKATQETVGIYNTDEKGNYAIEIAKNGGDYQFNIETTADAPIHTGVVTIPKQDEFEVLGQELRLVGVGNEQQLVIKNIFDGTTADNLASRVGPKISSEFIKMKANLEVNYSSNQLSSLKEENLPKEIVENKTPDASAVKSEPEDITEDPTISSVTEKETLANTSITEKAILKEENLPKEIVENKTPDASVVKNEPEDITEDPTISSATEKETLANTSISEKAIVEKLEQIKTQATNNIDQKQQVVSTQYTAALELQEEADQYFAEAEELKANGASLSDIETKQKEGGIKALESSFATQIAQRLEESINDDLSNLDAVETAEIKIGEMMASDNFAEAELTVNNLQQKESISAKKIIQEELESIEENNRIANKKVTDFASKNQSFTEEKDELKQQVDRLTADLETAPDGKKEELQRSIDAMNLDLEDLNYQSKVLSDNLVEAELTKRSLKEEKEELLAALTRVNTNVETDQVISEEKKNQLITKLKTYRDENLLAYSTTNELYIKEINIPDDESVAANQEAQIVDNSGEVEGDLEITEKSLSESGESQQSKNGTDASTPTNLINFSAQLERTNDIEDTDLRLANQIKIYDEWINNLSAQKAVIQSEYDTQIDEAERANVKNELDQINANLREKSNIKKTLEEELNKGAEGKVTAEVLPVSNIDEIDENSIIEDGFTNLDFDQTYKVNNSSSVLSLIEAKKKLFQAGEIAKQEKLAQESVYSLPTAEERTQAFAQANNLKKQSEKVQLEAAELFAKLNLTEYRLNRAKINEASNLNNNNNTSSFEIAELLSEEAQAFFTDAAIIRSEINEGDRLSQKEVKLQKAYDYEILALKKQKEALEKLGLAADEVVTNRLEVSNQTPKKSQPFVQAITDESVLAVVEASDAKQKAEALSAEVVSLNNQAEQQENQANSMDAGAKQDSVLALVKELRTQADQKLTAAAIMYERERQIEAGLVGISDATSSPESKVLPIKEASIYNQVAIDTVEVSEERRNFLFASQNFKDFASNRQRLVNQLKEAELTYSQALEVARENEQLRKDAIIETSKAKVVKEEEEKKRLIKSAQVIESKIAANEKQIEELNNIIKVKNFLVVTLEKKDKELISQLTDLEKEEYVSLSQKYDPEAIAAEVPSQEPLAQSENTFSDELSGEETSEAPSGLEELIADDAELAKGNTALDLPDGVVMDDSEDEIIDNSPENNEEPVQENQNPVVENGILDQTQELPNKAVEEKNIEPELKLPKDNNSVSPPVKENSSATPLKIENIDVIPRQVKQAIFITLNRDESAYSESNPIPTKTKMPEGIVYKVQIGAFRKPVPQSTFKGFAPLMAEKTSSGITRYTAGLFATENSAIQARNEIRSLGYPDAFVVAFIDGERIGVSAARKKTGETGTDSSPDNLTNTLSENVSRNNVNQVEGGSKEALSASFSKPNLEDVVNAKTVKGLYYTVQIGVFSAPVKEGTFEYANLNVVELSNGLIRYNAGMFQSVIAAADLKNTILSNIKDAFVTAYYNGERVSLEEAIKLKNQQ